MSGFSEEQKQYMQGYVMGSEVARALKSLPVMSNMAGGELPGTSISVGGQQELGPVKPELMHYQAMAETEAAGKKLCKEEKAKQEKNPLDMHDQMAEYAAEGQFPKKTDVFLWKFHGLFYTSPVQEGYMCRLRMPGGVLNAWQFAGVADLAEKHAGGYVDVTTRANLQLREIPATESMNVLHGLVDLGLVNRGAGGDNVRNVTGSPTAGIDPEELMDTREICKAMHHHILNRRELFGLPRKFNIAFDGGGRISSLQDTNDIGFTAYEVSEAKATSEFPPGIYMRLELGGITGHHDFARDTGVMLKQEDCVAVADAILKVFIKNGDRTNRKTARLKYVLDAWGFEKFLKAVEEEWGKTLTYFPIEDCEPRPEILKAGHLGWWKQKQEGLNYVGVVLPVGRLTPDQVRGLARISQRYGSGLIRLTVWQNLLIDGVADEDLADVDMEIKSLGLYTSATNVRGGLVACTGNAGCKYAGADTKAHAKIIADYLEENIELDELLNIHLTGCHHSCAQHYIGDIGLIATSVEVGDDMVEGYDIVLGGGYGTWQGIGEVAFEKVAMEKVPALIHQVLAQYQQSRQDAESFVDYVRRVGVMQLKAELEGIQAAA